MVELISAIIAIAGMWGSLWYKLGKLTSEVKGHNQRLDKMDKKLEELVNRR